ncbi:hypothetical protein A2763_00745 [Candidatus Kaiserbacteria bacterium RIFCSPHIGHO2_01_FULL_54_36]|uniref:Uncharacterized protein n=1 Tax=Candidatus Kaiserbacteria bacterium RIFCSPHIGHO2_01_FULL_54_36 TaxID=1798482 RepID=A0A1F6CP45_9BACT|nr:MAG: hypothetical protein A2763_00745 [Candidatus Kaiserbacteria bacterium RIFCSPHIGHO2_01_FULL_54_36]OGG75556.1 MAG: hypothetical protein A3A41_02950 [Candidatus Kaiserbacteria bacterium RIFCSPLOWO2_01_FULL_54_22]
MTKFLTATTAIILVATAAAFAQTTPAPAPAATPAATAAPRVLTVDRKQVKVWGVPKNQHFTANRLFPNFWQRCPTGLVRADIVTDPALIKKYKAPNVDYLYHFVCLEEEPTSPAT